MDTEGKKELRHGIFGFMEGLEENPIRLAQKLAADIERRREMAAWRMRRSRQNRKISPLMKKHNEDQAEEALKSKVAVVGPKEELSEVERAEAKRNLPTGDLAGFTPWQEEVMGKLMMREKLGLTDRIAATKWMMEDKGFREAYERRRLAKALLDGFQVDENLLEATNRGDAPSIRLWYQKTGALPVGGEYVAPTVAGAAGLGKEDLEERIKRLEGQIKEKTKE